MVMVSWANAGAATNVAAATSKQSRFIYFLPVRPPADNAALCWRSLLAIFLLGTRLAMRRYRRPSAHFLPQLFCHGFWRSSNTPRIALKKSHIPGAKAIQPCCWPALRTACYDDRRLHRCHRDKTSRVAILPAGSHSGAVIGGVVQPGGRLTRNATAVSRRMLTPMIAAAAPSTARPRTRDRLWAPRPKASGRACK